MTGQLAKVLFVSMSVCFLVSCSAVYDKHVQWTTVKPESFPVLKAVGQAPISLQKSNNETQRMLLAIKASKLAAYAELAEQVFGQQVNGKNSMSNLVMGNSELKTSINGVIRGARVVRSYPVGDTYTTELELDFKQVYDIYSGSVHNRKIKDVKYY
ncbi:LPP20 family lipoprotein [Thalassotalea piscium]